MRRAFTSSITVISVLLIIFGCGSSGNGNQTATQKEFGVRMAKMNLWREAEFRFRRAVQIDPNDAMARNNWAVALEAIGNFEAAGEQYLEALRLDRSNQHIVKNYSRFKEFTTKKRDVKATAETTSTAPKGPTRPVTTTDIPTETTSTDDMTTTNPPSQGGSR
jgi:Flp pilus assembly protein TadD